MGLRETLKIVHQYLTEANIEHALIGGLGLALLGIHRATFDIDFLVDVKRKNDIKEVLIKNGWKIALETEEVIHFDGKGNVDFLFASRPMSLEMLSSAKPAALGLKCVSAEGIIALKIQAYKNDSERELKDKADIKALIDKFPDLNWESVKKYADIFNEWSFIQSLRKIK